MSIHDRAAAAMLAQLILAADGALFGVGVAYVAYRSIRKFFATSSALRKIRDAPSVRPSDLRVLLSEVEDSGSFDREGGNGSSSNFGGGKLVVVRGSVAKGSWKDLRGFNGGNVLVSLETGERGVILQRTETCVYNEWRGAFGWTADLRSLLSSSWNEHQSSSIRTVPFVLVKAGIWPQSDYLVVNMEGSRHPLPLTTIYHHLQPINATPYTFFQALFGLQYPVGLLYEEKILPLGKDITAVGICNLKDGILEIKSCKDLPYFLSCLTKDQIVADLSFKSKVLMWSGLVFGSLAVVILGYSIARNWIKWKQWRHQQRTQHQNDTSTNETAVVAAAADDEPEDIPDGELCVICLMRRRRSAFIPCGHLVCCQRCALSVECEVSPKCPVCRQPIRSSVRIYDS